MPDKQDLFQQIHDTLKPSEGFLITQPKEHVLDDEFDSS